MPVQWDMKTPIETTPGYSLQPRLRVFAGRQMVIGWGKVMLLQLVQETGSIAEAARSMGMSYNHAWGLIRLMNASFKEPLVEATRGGKGKGGATVTKAGIKVLSTYQEMTEKCVEATKPQWRTLKAMLRPADEIPPHPSDGGE